MDISISEFLPASYEKIFPNYHVDLGSLVYLSGLYFLYDYITTSEIIVRILDSDLRYSSPEDSDIPTNVHQISFIPMTSPPTISNKLSKFLSDKNHSVAVMTVGNNSWCYYSSPPPIHKVAASIPFFFHQLFPRKNNRKGQETDVPLLNEKQQLLVDALYSNNEKVVRELFKEKFNKQLMQEKYIKTSLVGVDKKLVAEEIQALEQNITNGRERINLLHRQMLSVYQDIEDDQLRIIGLKTRSDTIEADKLAQFFSSIDCLEFIDCVDSSLVYNVYATSNVNPDKLHIMHDYIEMYDGILYSNVQPDDVEDFHQLLKYIFTENPLLGIKTFSRVKLSLLTNTNAPLSREGSSSPLPEDYLPHPHIMDYNCFGTGQTEVYRYLAAYDILGAVQQSIACCTSLNPGEINVVALLLQRVYKNKKKVLLTKDGKHLNYQEAIEWLKEKENENGISN